MQSFTEPMCYVTIVFDPQLAEFDDAFTETAFFGGFAQVCAGMALPEVFCCK